MFVKTTNSASKIHELISALRSSVFPSSWSAKQIDISFASCFYGSGGDCLPGFVHIGKKSVLQCAVDDKDFVFCDGDMVKISPNFFVSVDFECFISLVMCVFVRRHRALNVNSSSLRRLETKCSDRTKLFEYVPDLTLSKNVGNEHLTLPSLSALDMQCKRVDTAVNLILCSVNSAPYVRTVFEEHGYHFTSAFGPRILAPIPDSKDHMDAVRKLRTSKFIHQCGCFHGAILNASASVLPWERSALSLASVSIVPTAKHLIWTLEHRNA